MTWEHLLDNNITTLEQLMKYARIPFKETLRIKKVIERHPMSITPYYASLINWKDANDPLLRMSVPAGGEMDLAGTYDTSGERENTKMPGLQHKYAQTALILVTNRCALYCRYCFRKRLVGLPTSEIMSRFQDAVAYIHDHREINNVLISGGDPFVLPTGMLERFLKAFERIKHVDFIRFGTKVPVSFPQRILKDRSLLKALKHHSRPDRRVYVVTQFNHPREITPESVQAVSMLLDAGVVINNQTVLLKQVNDDPKTLAVLMEGLVRIGVNPYYVFQCRPVKRVKRRFEESLYRGYHIVEAAKKLLNGHSKRFKYVMSHKTGKIEIVGINGKDMYFKYHQARDERNAGKFFKRRLDKNAGWLDDLHEHHFLSGILPEQIRALFT
ncbi:MAG: KamA family radical SAM protein [Candidatus Omnitrophica bacterium]|nr:KamA family radical SAM protein [Candidatus Omnitrophota bacterium]